MLNFIVFISTTSSSNHQNEEKFAAGSLKTLQNSLLLFIQFSYC